MANIYLYNTLGRKKQLFKPIKKGQVGIYSCGPTVYWNQHIGHMYAYTQWDTMIRFFKYCGYKTKWVMNITDVGHMVSDQDVGEDKMEKGAKREGLSVWKIAEKYIKQFLESMDLLNIQKPDTLCRATEHIQEQIELIKLIEKNGFTYKTKTGIVFDTAKFSGYADFAKLNLKEQEVGARVEVDEEKKQPWDFLLWITNQPNHIMQWDSPWGRGFPGWHIECTAMSTKYLCQRFDIHTGGKEHIPVHHTNEIAQAFGAFGKQTANYWLHNDWLTLKGEKISKSLGNMVLVTDLLEKGFSSMHFRYLTLTSHYRSGMNFTWKSLAGARSAYEKLIDLMSEWRKEKGSHNEKKQDHYKKEFTAKLGDDLNFPEGLALVWQLAKTKLPGSLKFKIISDFDKVLGLKLTEAKQEKFTASQKIKDLLKKRNELRRKEDWLEADKIRQEIAKLGWEIEDSESGARLKKSLKTNI